MGAGNLTDEQLLKRAGNAARNLRVLGILATLGALMAGAILLVGKGATAYMWPVALAVTSLAAGYWTLAVAARRGNPNSVAVVLVIMVIQLVIVFVSAGIAAARTNTDLSSNLPGLIIPTLVLIALVSSRGCSSNCKIADCGRRLLYPLNPAARFASLAEYGCGGIGPLRWRSGLRQLAHRPGSRSGSPRRH